MPFFHKNVAGLGSSASRLGTSAALGTKCITTFVASGQLLYSSTALDTRSDAPLTPRSVPKRPKRTHRQEATRRLRDEPRKLKANELVQASIRRTAPA